GMVDRVSMAIDAVDALAKKDYDAVMIDHAVDGVYGYELARMMREDLGLEGIIIIVVVEREDEVCLAKENGADRCIEKPLNGKVLLDSLLKSGKFSVTH